MNTRSPLAAAHPALAQLPRLRDVPASADLADRVRMLVRHAWQRGAPCTALVWCALALLNWRAAHAPWALGWVLGCAAVVALYVWRAARQAERPMIAPRALALAWRIGAFAFLAGLATGQVVLYALVLSSAATHLGSVLAVGALALLALGWLGALPAVWLAHAAGLLGPALGAIALDHPRLALPALALVLLLAAAALWVAACLRHEVRVNIHRERRTQRLLTEMAEQAHAQQLALQSEKLAQAERDRLVELADVGLAVVRDGVVAQANPRARALFAFALQGAPAAAIFAPLGPGQTNGAGERLAACMRAQKSGREQLALYPTGQRSQPRWHMVSTHPLVRPGLGPHAIVTFADIDAAKRGQIEAETRAHTDALTGLPNRAWIEHHFKALPADHAAYAIGMIDMDGFKAINDTHGHDAGDRVLQSFAAGLARALRDQQHAVRLGGDEFVVLLHNVDSEQAASRIMQRVLEAACQPLVLPGGQPCTPRASFGVSIIAAGARVADPLKLADARMYEAKRARKAHAEPQAPGPHVPPEGLARIERAPAGEPAPVPLSGVLADIALLEMGDRPVWRL